MWTAYTFMALAVVGLMAILGLLSPIVALLVVWISQTFLQLTLLPIIMVGQNVLGRKSELQAEEQFNTCLLYTSPSPRDGLLSRMPSSA